MSQVRSPEWWEGACLHLLACKLTIQQCDVCQLIAAVCKEVWRDAGHSHVELAAGQQSGGGR